MGTIPDLDVLSSPFVLEWQQLGIHRGFSHSIFFPFLIAPLIGWLLYRFHGPQAGASRKGWSWLAFWGIFTHPFLDAFTVYGTQLLNPISDYPFSFNSIFIIDPMYTVPLFIGVFLAMRLSRDNPRRARWNWIGIGISSAYILFTLGVKTYVNGKFEAAFAEKGYQVEHYMTAPTALNSFLWMTVAAEGDGYWVGIYSIFDGDKPIELQRTERQSHLLDDLESNGALQRLAWFSNGYYQVRMEHGAIYWGDLRFGRSDNFLKETGQPIFRFRLVRDPDNPSLITNFKQDRPDIDARTADLFGFFSRVFGN